MKDYRMLEGDRNNNTSGTTHHSMLPFPSFSSSSFVSRDVNYSGWWDENNSDDGEIEEEASNIVCFMANEEEAPPKSSIHEEKWILDSGCSRHMTGNPSLFYNLTRKDMVRR